MKEVERITDEQVKEYAKGLVHNDLFVAQMCQHPMDVKTSFIPIGLGGLNGIDPKSVGTICEWYDKAGPRSVNGCPVFMSCNIIHMDDWLAILKLADKLQKAEESVLG